MVFYTINILKPANYKIFLFSCIKYIIIRNNICIYASDIKNIFLSCKSRVVAARPVWSGGSQGRGRPFTRSPIRPFPPPRRRLPPSPAIAIHAGIHVHADPRIHTMTLADLSSSPLTRVVPFAHSLSSRATTTCFSPFPSLESSPL
ncbi:hypothetical protein PUN28_004775 [Cardiocondyla obscurior]|uniref:Uncharacterized protein n=1 Tax=Cardiocondyla obscurior TaxID=286306 RepID=A0AAW2GH81_9HYME